MGDCILCLSLGTPPTSFLQRGHVGLRRGAQGSEGYLESSEPPLLACVPFLPLCVAGSSFWDRPRVGLCCSGKPAGCPTRAWQHFSLWPRMGPGRKRYHQSGLSDSLEAPSPSLPSSGGCREISRGSAVPAFPPQALPTHILSAISLLSAGSKTDSQVSFFIAQLPVSLLRGFSKL